MEVLTMGKTREVPTRSVPKKKASARKIRAKKLDLTPEQLARLAAFRAIVKFQREQWARMSPKERREADEKWELVKKTINDDRAGYRQVFVED
jgi:hypothetical protein